MNEWKKNLLKSLHSQLARQSFVTCPILEIYSSFSQISPPSTQGLNCKDSSALESSRTEAENFHCFIKKNPCVIFLTEFHILETGHPELFIALLISCIISSFQKRLQWSKVQFSQLFAVSQTTQTIDFI